MKMREHLKSFFGLSESRYHEITTFLTALTCALVVVMYPDLRQYLADVRDHLPRAELYTTFLIVGVFAIFGFMLSILHVFIQREKMLMERYVMGTFTIAVSALAGIKSGLEALASSASILIVFPIFNILMGMLMLYNLRMPLYDVTNENASLLEISGASLILYVVFSIAYFGFHLSWAMTFSICVFYSNMLFFLAKWMIKRFHVKTG